ncbi:MAG: hypothetical protein KF855_03285 [Acidobacteria bacterium]|nr:hypothetical protein [Acidobacteriota bacterium]
MQEIIDGLKDDLIQALSDANWWRYKAEKAERLNDKRREQNRILIEQCEKYQSLLADIKTSHEGYAGPPVYNPGIFNAQQIDENYKQVTKALKAAEEVE